MHLLTHSSGFAYDAGDPDFIKWATAVGRTENCMTHSLEGFTVPLKFQPGDGWVYGKFFQRDRRYGHRKHTDFWPS